MMTFIKIARQKDSDLKCKDFEYVSRFLSNIILVEKLMMNLAPISYGSIRKNLVLYKWERKRLHILVFFHLIQKYIYCFFAYKDFACSLEKINPLKQKYVS